MILFDSWNGLCLFLLKKRIMRNILLVIICLLCNSNICLPKNGYLGSDDEVVRVLAIGNSFSVDALEKYLYDLAESGGKKIVIGNLYISGAPIELHIKNAVTNSKVYSYRKINGVNRVVKENTALRDALMDEKWDYVSIQQSSRNSGKFETIEPQVSRLIDYVQKNTDGSPKFIYHQTWAYQKDSKHDAFSVYGNSQIEMYEKISATTKKLDSSHRFEFVVPCGTAIQNARTSSLGDRLTRDGQHLEDKYGRFTAACVWYEKLFGLDVRDNEFVPSEISDNEAAIAKAAAHLAVENPYKVTELNL